MRISWEDSKDVKYKHTVEGELSTLEVKAKFINPKLYIEAGYIDAEVTEQGDVWYFKFSFDDLPNLDKTSSYVFIEDDDQIYRLETHGRNKIKNFNNVKGVFYTEDYVYYFRNTASAKGRLTYQKKIKLAYESKEYQARQKKVHKRYKHKSRNQILIFEKEAMRFEESGARLFERIYKYPNVYFVVCKTSSSYKQLKEQYGEKIISPDEDVYLKLIHTARYYIGTELPMHLIGVRSPYKELRTEIMNTQKHKFIFLQHGVMQSLSLAGPNRSIFRKNHTYKPYKVIVSSKREADHFIEYGKYQDKDMWVVGLPTFDGKRINADADKVSVMLTWRPWDELKEKIEETTYYQAVKGIVESIEDKDNLQVILHPKVHEAIADDNPLKKYLIESSIDEALYQTKVFITDYSSAVFDAFYRGANIIFWWNEKEECLEKYKNELLLTNENAFGDIVYSNEQLNDVIKANYATTRDEYYIKKYKTMVEFDDDKNTDRLIEKLLTDKVLKNSKHLIN